MSDPILERLIAQDREAYAYEYQRTMIGGYAITGALYSGAAVAFLMNRPGVGIIAAGIGAFFHNEAGDDRAMYEQALAETHPVEPLSPIDPID